MTRKSSFAPLVDARTRVLVLGSLPGEKSLAAHQYYAHPQNGFWRLIGRIVGLDLAALPYAERLPLLLAAGVGLWDSVGTARRTGSLDTAIRDVEANDLAGIVARLPMLRLVAFNGKTSAAVGARLLPPDTPRFVLPSSSPAHTMSFAAKAEAWSVLRDYL